MKQKNFLKIALLVVSILMLTTTHSQIISQYVETDSGTTPKGIEIWNNTGSTLDFATNNLVIEKGANSAAPSADITISSGTLSPGEVMVIGTSDMGTYLTDQGLGVTFVLKAFTFNGDDSLVVKYGATTTDTFGNPGNDPGSAWSGSGVSTANQNIRLLNDITTGDTDGWTDPSTRFTTVSSSPATLPAGLSGFGIPPNIWSGAIDSDWATAGNWSAGVPVSTSDVFVPSGLTNYPTASGAVTVNTLTMASGTTLIAQNTFTGTVTYQRNLATTNWYLMSPPVSGVTFNDAFVTANSIDAGTGNNRGVATYTTGTDAWSYLQSAGTINSINGQGYSVKRASAGNISFTGTLNTSDVTNNIVAGGAGGFNLVGNPFTSFIAANNNADATHNLLKVNDTDNDFLTESTLWFWNQATSSYDQVNQASAAFYVAPSQGFFVSANGSHSFSFTEAMQSHQGADSFQRNNNSRPEVQLILTDGSLTRDADIYYIDGTTTGFDNGYDSSIFGGVANTFTVYTQAVANSTGRKLGIQSLPNTDLENMVIPVGVIANAGNITFSVNASNLPTGYKVYLEDKQTGDFVQLDEANSKYEVNLAESLNGIGRFFLHTTTNALSTDPLNVTNVSAYLSSKNNLRVVGIQQGTTKVSIYNILGKQVLNTSFDATGVNDVQLPSVQQGVYIVQIVSERGTINKKIVIE